MTEGPGWAAPDPQQPAGQQPPPPMPPPMPPPPGSGWSVPKPGVIPLRPLGLGEILDGAISTMRAHPKVILGVSAIVATISQLLTTFATAPLLDDANRAAKLGNAATNDDALHSIGASAEILGITLLIALPVRVFLAGFLTIAVGKAVLGQAVAFGEVWSRVRPRLAALLGLTLVYPAVAAAAAVIAVFAAVLGGALGILLALGMLVVGVWLYVMFWLATPALMLENAGISKAFGRSRALVRGSWWRIFGIFLLAIVMASIVVRIVEVPFTFLGGGGFAQPAEATFRYLSLTTIGAIIASTLTEPFLAGVNVLLYTDQRMRREGMDIELAQAAGVPPRPQW